jgi:hypothetical protein
LFARSALTKGFRTFVSESSDRLDFVLIYSKVQLGTGAVQSMCRPSEASEVCNLNELFIDCCFRECVESKGVQHLKVLEGPPQGVPVGVFLKDSKSSKGSKRLSAVKN